MAKLALGMKAPEADVVVGIPRSGMLAASMLALRHHLRLAEILAFAEERRVMSHGPRLSREKRIDRALVVDDSVLSGQTMRWARRKLAGVGCECIFGAMYVEPSREALVDFHGELLPRPRIFEWNILHHGILGQSCVDIDGVLCVDPTERQNDDGVLYERFLREAEPRYIPAKEIGWLVTSRLEKCRRQTAQWLSAHGVRYRSLVMLDLASKKERLEKHAHAAHKAAVYRRTGARLFIESSDRQARTIAVETGRPVFCTDTWRLY